MILTELPDLRDPERRRAFSAVLERENCMLVLDRVGLASPLFRWPGLCVIAALGCTLCCELSDHSMTVSDEMCALIGPRSTFAFSRPRAGAGRVIIIHFCMDLLRPVPGRPYSYGIDGDCSLLLASNPVSSILRYLSRVWSEGHRAEEWYQEQQQLVLDRLLRTLDESLRRAWSLPYAHPQRRRKVYRRLMRGRDYLLSNIRNRICVGDAAQAASMGRSHFMRLFQHVEGVTPHRFIRQHRAARAARLLTHTQLPIDVVARECGLEDRSALYRLCVRDLRVTPWELRQGRAGADPPRGDSG